VSIYNAHTFVTSAARTTNGNSASVSAGIATTLNVLVDVTATGGVSPTMTLSVEWSHNGTDWFTPDTAENFTQLTAASKKVKTFTVKAPFYRLVWTLGGTSPSFTFSATAYGH
jgi:hypothetical protein